MRKLLCLMLMLLFIPVLPASAESAALGIQTPAEAIRPGKAFMLTFSAPAEGTCDLLLRDRAGNPVMDVVLSLPVQAGSNQLWWNGTSAGVPAAEGVYQLVLAMNGMEASCTLMVGPQAPYLTSILPVKDAESQTMTVDFYASVEGLLSVGLWNGNVWSLLENRRIEAGMNQVVWDASGIPEKASALTLTLTDSTGFSSNEEHIAVSPEDFGVVFATPVPEEAPADYVLTPVSSLTGEAEQAEELSAEAEETPVEEVPAEEEETPAEETGLSPVEAILTPINAPVAEAEEPDEAAEADQEPEMDASLGESIDLSGAEAEEDAVEEAAEEIAAVPAEEIVYTPSYGTAYALTEADAGTYWGTPMDITDEEAIWRMLSAPITVIDSTYKGQKKVYAEPDEKSRAVAVVTGTSQGVRVIEERDDGWTLIELYSSTFHDNSIKAWNMLVQGYVKTSMLKTKTLDDKYHIVVDKLTQRLYLFGEGKHLATLLVSTGLSNAKQPYNETRSGEFLYISATGGFKSDNMVCPMGMKFNDGDLLHEVPYVQRSEGGSKIYSTTEPYLGTRASHGCIRVQRKKNPDGYNMKWIWDHRKDLGRIVVWEDWQGRQVSYPAEDTVLYYNPKGGTYYHSAETCNSAKSSVTFAPFTYAELDTGDYAELEFCPYCVPALRKAEIDKINAAHALGGDHDPILTEARQSYLEKIVKDHGLEALTEAEMRYYQPAADD